MVYKYKCSHTELRTYKEVVVKIRMIIIKRITGLNIENQHILKGETNTKSSVTDVSRYLFIYLFIYLLLINDSNIPRAKFVLQYISSFRNISTTLELTGKNVTK